ncbi:hypothetical protein [Nocardioides jejuensis]|uniref:Uncharacterized protein n=1 Tax=Nocardioides jejuensis TaxID=2502782 RepID=A0A4R1CH50_9ACTN|nr:hypothetical protein [Nocardioides jejuensis]TCJ29416.1 hypothetical protein EPD65_06760 [Nocardioides jejuensis]
MIFRGPRSLAQSMAFAVAKAVVVTLAFLAGHVTLSVATDLYGFAAPAPATPSTQVVEVRQTDLVTTP